MPGKVWTEQEDKILIDNQDNPTALVVSLLVNRTPAAVKMRKCIFDKKD